MSPNRIVAFLTPLVFAPAAGAASAWIAQHFPGTNISSNDLQAIFIGGALIALAPAAQWLHGWQKYEERQSNQEHEIALANVAAAAASSMPPAADLDFDVDAASGFTADDALDDFDDVDDVDADLLVADETSNVN